MNEIEQMHDETLVRITLGLMVVGVVTAIVGFIIGDIYSPWFIRGTALFVIAIITYVFRLTGQLQFATYVLIFQLIGLVAEMFLQVNVLPTFAPYLLIPLAIITGVLLNSITALSLIAFTIGLALFVLLVTNQFGLDVLKTFLPSASLAMLAGLLTAESRKQFIRLGQRLDENRATLKHHTLTIMQSSQNIIQLKQQIGMLQNRLAQVKSSPATPPPASSSNDQYLFQLFETTIGLLDTQFRQLEQEVENVGRNLNRNGQSPSLETIWRKVDDLKSLAINLDEVTQIQKGETELALELVDIKQILADVTHITQGLARTKKLQVKHNLPDDLPTLYADPARLRQALLHILSNAVKYTDQGVIEICARKIDDCVNITISSTGIGIDKQEFDLVFENFGRASHTSTKSPHSIELGLAVAKCLIELHGGQITVSNLVDVGCEFDIDLPLEALAQPVMSATSTQPPSLLAADSEATLFSTVDTDATLLSTANADEPILSDPNNVAQLLMARTEASSTQESETELPSPLTLSTPPVSRMGPIYTRRFGLILLALLMLVSGVVAVLAFINGPVILPANTTTVAQPVEPTPTLNQMAELNNTATPEPNPTSIPLPPNTPSPTLAPPTPSATPLATPTSTPSPQPTATIIVLPSISPVAVTLPGVKILRLLSSQRISYIDFEDLPAPTEALRPDPNGQVHWSSTGQLMFTSDQNRDRDIYLVDPDGSSLNLTATSGDDIHPAWSADGRQIAFSSARTGNFEIYTADADGSNLTRLTNSRGFEEWPVWSPDGRQIAYVSDRNGNIDLFVMEADGSNQRQLTDHPGDDWPASWSPDGRQLVFASNRAGDWSLYIVPVSGGDAIRLTNDPGDERDPIWSAEGDIIAFTSNRGDNQDIYTLPAPATTITVVPASAWTQITNTPTDERYPTWLPAPANP